MNKNHLACLLIFGAGSLCLASQPVSTPSGSTAEPLHGGLLVRSESQPTWNQIKPGQSSHSAWLRTEAGGEAVVSFSNDAQLRMTQGTTVHIMAVDKTTLKLEVLSGKVYASVPPSGKSAVLIATPKGLVNSSAGDFVVEVAAHNTKVQVLDGRAALTGKDVQVAGMGPLKGIDHVSVQPGMDASINQDPDVSYLTKTDLMPEVANDGPDVRARTKNQGKFTQGELNQGKRLGEEETPSPSPSPASTPPPTSVQPQPDVPPPNNPPPQVSQGGGSAWPYVLGGLGLGTGLYFLLRDTGNNDQSFFVQNQVPASP